MDTIANLLTTIRNAELASQSSTVVPASKMNEAILTILKENDYIASFEKGEQGLQISLGGGIHHYKRLSKPGRRVYTPAKDIPTVLGGRGMVILSTPRGVLSGTEAKKQKVGGELICEVY